MSDKPSDVPVYPLDQSIGLHRKMVSDCQDIIDPELLQLNKQFFNTIQCQARIAHSFEILQYNFHKSARTSTGFLNDLKVIESESSTEFSRELSPDPCCSVQSELDVPICEEPTSSEEPVIIKLPSGSDDEDTTVTSKTLPFGPATAKRYESVFLSAALQLLDEKEAGNLGFKTSKPVLPSDTLLAGYLKKSKDTPLPIFTQKYAVLTKGMFSYYEDGNRLGGTLSGGSKRKEIRLDPSKCVCRAVTSQRLNNKHVFELIQSIDGNDGTKPSTIRRLWMAKSDEDRTIWMNAIRDAMKEDSSSTKSAKSSTLKGKEKDVKRFLHIQERILKAISRKQYVSSLELFNPMYANGALDVPVEWVWDQKDREECSAATMSHKNLSSNLNSLNTSSLTSGLSSSSKKGKSPRKRGNKCSMEQVFKDLRRDRVRINSVLYSGAEGPEVILGAFTKCLMEKSQHLNKTSDTTQLTESEALSIARDILIACNRTQSGGDTYEAVSFLCSNSELVVLCPTSTEAEPLAISVELVNKYEEEIPRGKDFVPHSPLNTRRDTTHHFGNHKPHGSNRRSRVASSPAEFSSESSLQYSDKRLTLLDNRHKQTAFKRLLKRKDTNSSSTKGAAVLQRDSSRVSEGITAPLEVTPSDVSPPAAAEETAIKKAAISNTIENGNHTTCAKGTSVSALPSHLELQVHVTALTSYKICDANPQGTMDDTWGYIDAEFHQSFSYASFYGAIPGSATVRMTTRVGEHHP